METKALLNLPHYFKVIEENESQIVGSVKTDSELAVTVSSYEKNSKSSFVEWSQKEASAKRIMWMNTGEKCTPYIVLSSFIKTCSFSGKPRIRLKKSTSDDQNCETGRKKRKQIPPSKKVGCKAKLYIKKVKMYKDHSVPNTTKDFKKKKKMKHLIENLSKANYVVKILVTLPKMNCHTNHELNMVQTQAPRNSAQTQASRNSAETNEEKKLTSLHDETNSKSFENNSVNISVSLNPSNNIQSNSETTPCQNSIQILRTKSKSENPNCVIFNNLSKTSNESPDQLSVVSNGKEMSVKKERLKELLKEIDLLSELVSDEESINTCTDLVNEAFVLLKKSCSSEKGHISGLKSKKYTKNMTLRKPNNLPYRSTVVNSQDKNRKRAKNSKIGLNDKSKKVKHLQNEAFNSNFGAGVNMNANTPSGSYVAGNVSSTSHGTVYSSNVAHCINQSVPGIGHVNRMSAPCESVIVGVNRPDPVPTQPMSLQPHMINDRGLTFQSYAPSNLTFSSTFPCY